MPEITDNSICLNIVDVNNKITGLLLEGYIHCWRISCTKGS